MRRLALPLVGFFLLATLAGAATEPVPIRGLRAEIAALLIQGVAGGSLPVAAAVFSRPGGDDAAGSELTFLLELEAAPPADTDGERPVEVYAYAIDDAGEVAAHLAVTVPEWPVDGEGLKVSGRLGEASGNLSVRFLVWDPAARRYGMAVRRIDLDAGAAAPRLAEECSGWTLAGSEATELLGLSARPVLVAGETRRLTVPRSLAEGAWQVRLTREAGDSEISQQVAASVAGTDELEFVVPDLAEGIYQLSVNEGESWASRPVESWLVATLPPADSGCRRSWGRVLSRARMGSPTAEPQREPAAAEGKPAADLLAEYQAVMRRLAVTGDLISAAGELAGVEAPMVSDETNRVRLLLVTELAAARELAERDPRSLLPLITLHAEVYDAHYEAGRFPLATHSRRLALAIADLAAEHLPAPEERALIAVALTGLADRVESRRASIEAQRLLERALSLDESQEATRLLLAVSYERKGRYGDARHQLEILVSANSAHYEARVRLGILLHRVDQPAEAERVLSAVVAERPPDWLLSLGYQTLAQVLIRQARLSEAVAVLEEARKRLPGDQAAQLLLAYALDRSGERQAVQETLEELPPAEAAASPRFYYSDRPVVALGLLRETLRQSFTVRLTVLAVVLGADQAGGPAG